METREWNAWLNLQPPPPDDLHAVGQVKVGNPGIVALLVERTPQGINPEILLLDLFLVQRPGFWIQRETWINAHFSKVYQPGGSRPSRVDAYFGTEKIVSEDVIIVQ